jgi:hypothetical protein
LIPNNEKTLFVIKGKFFPILSAVLQCVIEGHLLDEDVENHPPLNLYSPYSFRSVLTFDQRTLKNIVGDLVGAVVSVLQNNPDSYHTLLELEKTRLLGSPFNDWNLSF